MTVRAVVGWGSGADGQLGAAVSEVTSRPRRLLGLAEGVVPHIIAAGLWSSLVVADCGAEVYETSIGPREAPRLMAHLPNVSAVACGRDFSVLVTASGAVYTVGSGAYGQLGLGLGAVSVPEPEVVSALSNLKIIAVAAAEFHWLALDALGRVFACGRNASGQLGLGHTDNTAIPTPVTALWPLPVVSVATGDHHSTVVTADGSVWCFGSNKHGQLGQQPYHVKVCSLLPVEVPVPQTHVVVKRSALPASGDPGVETGVSNDVTITDAVDDRGATLLAGSVALNAKDETKSLMYVDVACGQSHTVALRSDGAVVCWGNGENGQLGSRATRTMYTPTVVNAAEEFVAVSAGALHSAALTVDGVAYLWGDGSLGQIGDGDISDKLLPVLLPQPRLFQHTPGSEDELATVEAPFRFLSLVCGGYHSLAIVSNDPEARVVSAVTRAESRIPLCVLDSMVSAKSGLARFGSAAVLLRSFIVPGLDPRAPRKIKFEAVEAAYTSFMSLFGMEGAEVLGIAAAKLRHEAQIAFGLVKDDDKMSFGRGSDSVVVRSLITPRSKFLNDDDSFRPTVANMESCGHLFMIAIMNPVYSEHERVGELSELAAVILRVEDAGRDVFLHALMHCPRNLLITRVIRPLQGVLTDELRAYRRITKNAIVATKALSLCFHAVLRASERALDGALVIPRHEFYNETVSEMVDLREDYMRWSGSQQGPIEQALSEGPPLPLAGTDEGKFSFCSYSFLLSEAAKFRILGIESNRTMEEESTRSMSSFGYLPLPIGPWGNMTHMSLDPEQMAHLQFLVLNVRRNNIVSDAFVKVADLTQHHARELHKPLKVVFDGEEGVDEGGVRKEFYQVLLEHILTPDYGMFEYDEETRFHWFRRDFLEPKESWTLIGIMFGLAAFNSILLDVQFPPVVYRKLRGVFRRNLILLRAGREPDGSSEYEPTLDDVKEVFPAIGNSLQHLLDYDGDDVEEVFCLTHEVSYKGLFGKVETVELVKGGGGVPVSNSNRAEFVRLYIAYLINDSIAPAFTSFAVGFSFMLNGPFVHFFSAEELETLVVGEKELDFDAMRETTKYEGYLPSSPVIKWLWEVLAEYDIELQRQFLSFVTGTDRAPIGGLKKLGLVVQRSGGNSERLPTSHTCFNVLLLPEYASRAKLRDRLTTAIRNSQGFGLR